MLKRLLSGPALNDLPKDSPENFEAMVEKIYSEVNQQFMGVLACVVCVWHVDAFSPHGMSSRRLASRKPVVSDSLPSLAGPWDRDLKLVFESPDVKLPISAQVYFLPELASGCLYVTAHWNPSDGFSELDICYCR
jgi:hypothetical protein